jgi:hypothetical protein|tara:strand:+ start:3011 stop:3472 length:462 start_codon:yes stop_codon:yes gene_type:complete
MKIKNTDSSPLKIVAEVFNVKDADNKNQFNRQDISLLTEINNRKVILEFNWIEDLNLMVSSFIIEDFDQNILYQNLSKINNNLIIGTLRQNVNKSVIYKHTLPLGGKNESVFIKKYLEDLLSEFNHLITVLLKNLNSKQHLYFTNNNKIVGHA